MLRAKTVMSNQAKTPQRTGLYLAGFCLLCMGMIALVWQQLAPRINDNRRAQEVQILLNVLGGIDYDNDLLASQILYSDEQIAGVEILRTWQALRGALSAEPEVVATVIDARAPNGYSGPIRFMVGIDSQGKIIAVRVTEHSETPGLGDQIDHRRSDWINQFNHVALNPDNPQSAQIREDGGQFDKISGATVTSRAVVQTLAIITRWHLLQ